MSSMEEVTGYTNEATKDANKALRNLPSFSYFMFYCFINSIN